MFNQEFVEHFCAAWIEAWNAHDLDRVLAHYTDDFQMSSPYIAQIAGEPSGTLRGKVAVRAYWRAALDKMPALKFTQAVALAGADSIAIHYQGVKGPAIEVFFFNEELKIYRACAHYS